MPDQLVREWEEQREGLNKAESDYGGQAVDVILVQRQSRKETFGSHYIRGSVSAAHQPGFFPFCGIVAATESERPLATNRLGVRASAARHVRGAPNRTASAGDVLRPGRRRASDAVALCHAGKADICNCI